MTLTRITLDRYTNTMPQGTQIVINSASTAMPAEAVGLLTATGGTSSVTDYFLIFEDGAAPAGSSLTDGATYGPSFNTLSGLTVYNGTWGVTASILTGGGGVTGDIILHFE